MRKYISARKHWETNNPSQTSSIEQNNKFTKKPLIISNWVFTFSLTLHTTFKSSCREFSFQDYPLSKHTERTLFIHTHCFIKIGMWSEQIIEPNDFLIIKIKTTRFKKTQTRLNLHWMYFFLFQWNFRFRYSLFPSTIYNQDLHTVGKLINKHNIIVLYFGSSSTNLASNYVIKWIIRFITK